jgi:hypothetical protein
MWQHSITDCSQIAPEVCDLTVSGQTGAFMLKLRLALGLLFTLLMWMTAGAGTVVPIPSVPGAVTTFAYGINDKNLVTGYFFDSNFVTHGFFGTLDGQYTTFDFGHGLSATLMLPVDNAGDILGIAFDGAFCQATQFERMADGTVIVVHKKKIDLDGTPGGFNQSGEFVGNYCDESGKTFGYYGRNGRFKKDLTIPGDHLSVAPTGINKFGQVVGYVADGTQGNAVEHGFFLDNGTTNQVDYPGVMSTLLSGINDHGMAAGYGFSPPSTYKPFLYNTTTKEFTPIDSEGFSLSTAAINNEGNVVLNIRSSGGALLYCPRKKNCPAQPSRH